MTASLSSVATHDPQQILASVWQRSLPVLRKRLSTLNDAARAASDGHLSASARKEASEIAHKLAGSLGMFGYMCGTEIAQQLEILLDSDGTVPAARFEELTAQLAQTLQI